jgi:uncharacterized membrane protein YedE/YeeE
MENKKNTYYEMLVKREWSYTTGAVLMAVLAVMLAAFAGSWGVLGPLPLWGGKVLTLTGIDADSWKMYNGSLAKYRFLGNQAAMTNVALIFGGMISCLLAAQWKIRGVKSARQVWAAVIGGTLMGIGGRINPGCNIGAMFSSIPAFSLSGWVYLVFMFLGAVVGGKALARWFLPPVSHERRERPKKSPEQHRRNRAVQIAVAAALIIAWLVFAAATKEAAPSAGFILFIGLGIGYAMQHSRFCFTAACRDPALTGSTKITKALLVALAVSTIGFAGLHLSRYGADLSKLPETPPGGPIGLHLVIGAFLFGGGAALAGCCASGTFVRIGEGSIQAVIALVFFIIGSMAGGPLMSNVVQKSPLLYSGKGVYLPQLLGGFGPAILLQLAVLLLLWIAADRWEQDKGRPGSR